MPYYPPSPQYKPVSSSEDEAEQAPAAKGKYTDPTPTPNPRDESINMDQDEAGKEGDSPRYSTPPEAVDMSMQQKHTILSSQLDKSTLGSPGGSQAPEPPP